MPSAASVLATQAPFLEILEPELYLDSQRDGYFAIWKIDPIAGAARRGRLARSGLSSERVAKIGDGFQSMHHLSELEVQVEAHQGKSDVYISQLMFRAPPPKRDGTSRPLNRQKRNAVAASSCFIDLDIGIERFQVDIFLKEIFTDMIEASIIRPSYVVFSGRGFHFKWLFDGVVPTPALARWDLVQKELVAKFATLNWDVDRKAIDRSRVLRLPGTYNSRSKSRDLCEIVWVNRFESGSIRGSIRRFSFDEFADDVLPLSRTEYRAKVQREYDARGQLWAEQNVLRQEKYEERGRHIASEINAREGRKAKSLKPPSDHKPKKGVNRRRLAFDRAQDLTALLELRNKIPATESADREAIIFWILVFEGHCGTTAGGDFCERARAIAQQHCPPEWSERHEYRWTSHLTTLRRRYEAWSSEDKDAMYTPKNATLISCLKITPDEQSTMKTLIGPDEKRRRRIAKARGDGVQPREEYEAGAKSKTRPWIDAGVSRATFYRRIAAHAA